MSRPADWSAAGMDADPVPGDPDALRHAVIQWGDASETISRVQAGVTRVGRGVTPQLWEGESGDAFRASLQPIPGVLSEWGYVVDDAATAVTTWANAIADAQAQADPALNRARAAREDLNATAGLLRQAQRAVETSTMTDLPDAETALRARAAAVDKTQADLDGAIRTITDAKDAYDRAARRVIRTMREITDDVNRLADRLLPDTGLTYTQLQHASPATRLEWLENADPAAIAAMLKNHPGLVQEFWNHPPDPRAVAAWWAGLPSAARDLFTTDAPGIIGNLGGIPYSVRDTANRTVLAQNRAQAEETITTLERELADTPSTVIVDGVTGNNPSAQFLTAELAAARTRMNAFNDITVALRSAPGSAPRSLEGFDPDQTPPLAAVGIGDLGTAQDVTYAVPGMDNRIGVDSHCMKNWAGAAQNLYMMEGRLDPLHTHAVIAAISYTSPGLLQEPSSAAAQAGAVRVASQIDAITATRPGVQVSVLGHSYGTTVVSNAMVRTSTRVHDVVLLASAGLQHQPDTFHVDAADGQANVYATHASGDTMAPIGFRTSNTHKIGPGDPVAAGQWSFPAGGPVRTMAGGDAAHGVTIFSSDGGTYGDVTYQPTTGHSATGVTNPTLTDRGEIALGFEAPAGHGYLDPQTEALHNTAAAATGQTGKIVGPLTVEAP